MLLGLLTTRPRILLSWTMRCYRHHRWKTGNRWQRRAFRTGHRDDYGNPLRCGRGILIRIGSCGSLQEHVKIGDLVIVTGAIRARGTTSYYVPKNFSTVANPEIVGALKTAAESQRALSLGWIFTTDALFRKRRN
jgi:hypothetical protein